MWKSIFLISVFLVTGTMASDQQAELDKALLLVRADRSEEALPTLLKLASKGNTKAKIALGYYYLLEKNQADLKWFKEAANEGDPEAQLHYGLVLTEILEPRQCKEGRYWLEASAEKGNKQAAMQLSSAYHTGGCNTEKNPALSKYWLNKAHGE